MIILIVTSIYRIQTLIVIVLFKKKKKKSHIYYLDFFDFMNIVLKVKRQLIKFKYHFNFSYLE